MTELEQKIEDLRGLYSGTEQFEQSLLEILYTMADKIERRTEVMTGQEWYERFIAELDKSVDVNRKTQDFTDGILAAKRAAEVE